MAYDGWMTFNGVELFNLGRTTVLAEGLGIEAVWSRSADSAWVEAWQAPGLPYSDITAAPWYRATHPASAEFAGVIPLGVSGLEDSSAEATASEYLTNGGNPGRTRRATKSLVFSAALVASSERGAEYGRRWLTRVLRGSGDGCVGDELHYLPFAGWGAVDSVKHRRNVKLSRGVSVTKRRSTSGCSFVWTVTFTMTVGDPFEYGESIPAIEVLGVNSGVAGPLLLADGMLALVEQGCPTYDYSPLTDPDHPALVPSPSVPDLVPAGWGIESGMTFDRVWAVIDTATVPESVLSVKVEAPSAARSVRLSVWSETMDETDQCDPLFSAVLTYIPPAMPLYLDGEREAVFVWDGASPQVRRADGLAFSSDQSPVRWPLLPESSSLLVTLDIFSESGGSGGDMAGAGVSVEINFIPRSE